MTGPGPASAAPPFPPAPRAGGSPVPHAPGRYGPRRFAAAALSFAAAALAGVSSISSWWTLTESGGGIGTASLGFLPGNMYTVTASGLTGQATYASGGLGPLAGLYNGLLAGLLAVVVAAAIAGLLALLAGAAKVRSHPTLGAVTYLLLAVTAVAVVLAVVAPGVQPSLFHQANPGSFCTATTGSTPCNSFWGTAQTNGETATWGGDAGWYLDLGVIGAGVLALLLWRTGAGEPWSDTPRPTGPTPMGAARSGPPAAVLDRVTRLKALADSGTITAAEFEEVKGRLLLGEGPRIDPGSPVSPLSPEEELVQLRSMHVAGALSDAEYATLHRRALDRI
ncbi:MAG TPA: SHOCT domain-containing protein [Thermoplasmata archaeon]|nr:SHOCT domain-containing protein [Thermoplasmata archaeon]